MALSIHGFGNGEIINGNKGWTILAMGDGALNNKKKNYEAQGSC
jgi:hypothetical protein